jgi:hypothetical protein
VVRDCPVTDTIALPTGISSPINVVSSSPVTSTDVFKSIFTLRCL